VTEESHINFITTKCCGPECIKIQYDLDKILAKQKRFETRCKNGKPLPFHIALFTRTWQNTDTIEKKIEHSADTWPQGLSLHHRGSYSVYVCQHLQTLDTLDTAARQIIRYSIIT